MERRPQRLALIWKSDPTLYAPAKYRKACAYEAYVPVPLAESHVALDGPTAGVVSDAEGAIRALNASAHPALAPLARLLLRTESIASSRVEGLQVGARELAHAEAKRETGQRAGPSSMEVLANIDAMQVAVDDATRAGAFTVQQLMAIHARLMQHAANAKHVAGRIRETQNWIGGNDYNPCGADFVPPPPEYVPSLLEDLCEAVNDETLPPLVQAALVHAQFETIHPFEDGNGRTGRALVQVVLRRRGLASDYVPPISVALASAREAYIAGLTDFRNGDVQKWVERFASATARAAKLAQVYLRRVEQLRTTWRSRLKASEAPRADAAAWAIIDVLPGHPVITAPVAATETGRTRPAVYDGIRQLVAAGVLEPLTGSRRNQAWEAVGLLELLGELEAGRTPSGTAGQTQ